MPRSPIRLVGFFLGLFTCIVVGVAGAQSPTNVIQFNDKHQATGLEARQVHRVHDVHGVMRSARSKAAPPAAAQQIERRSRD